MQYDYIPEEYVEKNIDLRDYLHIILKRKQIILSILVVVVLFTIVKTYTTTPLYTASSRVLIERNMGNSKLDSQYYLYDPNFLATNIEIITSSNVAKKVVDNLQLATRYRHYFITDTAAKKSFVSALIEPVVSKVKGAASFLQEEKQSPATTISDDQVENREHFDREIIAGIIRGGLRAIPQKETKIVSISYTDKNPLMAQLVANAVVKAYMDEMQEIKLSSSSHSIQWMSDKARNEREKLEHSERELQKFMRENDLVTVEDKITLLPQKLGKFGSQLSQAETDKKEMQDLLRQIKAAGNNLEKLEKIPTLASNEVLKSIRERIYKANLTIKELSKKYGHKHPKMIKARDELRGLNQEKRYEIDRVLASITNAYELATSKEQSFKELLETTKSDMLHLNEKFMQYSIMKREVDSNRVMYESLQSGIKKISVTDQSQNVNIWVMKQARKPGAPSQPNKQKNILIGIFLGLISGLGCAFLVEFLDNTIKNGQDLEEKFGLTVLGTVAELKEKDESIDTFVRDNMLSPMAESFRLIRTGLLLSSPDRPPRTMLITSMGAKEGKTSTSANIARILAQSGNSVVIVDCDLRRPRLHQVFDMKSDIGLSSYLTGTTSESVVQKVPGEELRIIPSGPIPPAPAELLSSEKMKHFVQHLSDKFDFVLLDSPPVESVTDSLALSQYVDGTIIVVRAGKTTKDMLESGLKKFRDVNTRFLGFVLNGMKHNEGRKYYYYGYNSYYAKDE